ncbi:hypothetical protein PsorP6_005263 [Peronosclerospora sorghi]|uniref:Uncharacterized protein n=1 Tax=Peronosclerospora sorghi TaxID=230839 RepID=A0ACC0W3W5_9STRA|nr:hypothetical protein PsorP6_005263 [Peronosclerospora sorghi]
MLLSVLLLLILWLVARVVRSVRGDVFPLEDKVIVITGPASGIGRQLARTIFTQVSKVTLALVDINVEALEKLQSELLESVPTSNKKRVFCYECDVADYRAVSACVARVVADVAPNHIGVLVNNAGVVMGQSVEDLTPEQVQQTFAVNTLAHFWTLKAALPSMKKAPEALLVTVSSVMGMISSARLADYCASKAAVNAFHEAVRLELWRDNIKSIRTLLICPAAIETGMFAGIFDANDLLTKNLRLCLPLLPESQVVDIIYRAMRRGDTLVVSCFPGWKGTAIPWFLALLRLLPVSLYDTVVRLCGGLNGMDTFVGRNGSYKSNKEKVS